MSKKDAAVAVGDDALLEDGRRQQVVQLLRYAHTLAEGFAAGFIEAPGALPYFYGRFPRTRPRTGLTPPGVSALQLIFSV